MSKRNSHEVLASYLALIEDVRVQKPDLVSYFLESLPRLERLVETRGLEVVCIDLPELGKVFDKTLSSGFFDIKKVPKPLGSAEKGFLLEALFGDYLYEPHSCRTYATVDPDFVFFTRTFLYMLKDVVKEPTDARKLASVRKFFQIDASLRRPTLYWESDDLFDFGRCSDGVSIHPYYARRLSFSDGDRGTEVKVHPGLAEPSVTCRGELLALLDRVCWLSSSMFGFLDTSEVCGRHGPGAVSDVKTGEDKYTFPSWPLKLGRTFPFELYAQTNESTAHFDGQDYTLNEPMAKLLAVPKSMKGPRLITSEPTAHQFLQQGLLKWLRLHMPSYLGVSIDFKSQTPSRDKALEASRTGDLMTVDLSSASDRLSLWTVERAFQGNLSILSALHAVRSRTVINATRVGSSDATILRKYAGQGNATTFPVQTFIYTWISIACVLWEEHGKYARVTRRSLARAAKKVRVYGDDIILPSRCGHILSELLSFLQLEVNWAKTHHKGHFRESCGMDAYRGYDVTPLYMQATALSDKPTPSELVSWIDVSNNAYTKGLWALSTWMNTCIPKNILRDIPITQDPIGCLRFYTHTRLAHFRHVRVNSDLQCEEVHGYVLQSKEVREKRNSHQSLLQYFVEKPQPDSNYESGWVVRRRSQLRKRWVPTT
nr:MAG: hypothetical protein 3 [Leviviridae sp.]